jgi:tetratricopeptide (TPR) repeat protein
MAAKKRKKEKQDLREKPSPVSPPAPVYEAGRIEAILKSRAFAAILLFLVSFSVFIPSLRNGLVWDDVTQVRGWEPRLRSAELSPKLFVPSRPKAARANKYFRPVYFVSLVIDNRIWGTSPFGYHMTNIILHAASTVLLYFLVLLLFEEFKRGPGRSEALLASLLFAVYPLHVESVSFIAARGDILAGMFFLICLIFYILSYRRFFYILPAALAFYFSFLSKEVALAFPLIILGYDLVSGRLLTRTNIIKYLIIGILIFFYFYVRSGSFAHFLDTLHQQSFRETEGKAGIGEIVILFLGTYLFYVEKLLFPYSLNHFIGTIRGGTPFYIIVSVLLIAAVAAAFVISIRKREKITAFSLLWIFVALGPAVMVAIYPLAITRYAERFIYIPSMGFCMLIGYLVVRGGGLTGKKWAAAAAGGLLFASYLLVTVKGQEVWSDNITFWEAAVRKSPDQIIPKVNYGEALRQAGRVDEAIAQHRAALDPRIESTDRGKAMAASSLASDYIQKGDYPNAEKYLKAALEYNPATEGKYYYHMGLINLKKNDTEAALSYLRKAVEADPKNAKSYYVLGMIYALQAENRKSADDYRLAKEALTNSLNYDGGQVNARILLARVYLALGDRARAREQAEAAIKYTSDPVTIGQVKSMLNAIDAGR